MKSPQSASPRLTSTSRTLLFGSMHVSSNGASNVLTQQPDRHPQNPHLVLSRGPSLPLVLPLLLLPLRYPLLCLHPRHRLLLLGVFVSPHRLPTGRPPWSLTPVDSG